MVDRMPEEHEERMARPQKPHPVEPQNAGAPAAARALDAPTQAQASAADVRPALLKAAYALDAAEVQRLACSIQGPWPELADDAMTEASQWLVMDYDSQEQVAAVFAILAPYIQGGPANKAWLWNAGVARR
jgi:hypothetical protein